MSSQMRHDFEQTLQILNYVSLMEGLKKWEFFMRFVIKGGRAIKDFLGSLANCFEDLDESW